MTLLVVVALSLVVTRVGTVALTLTGLSCQAARFQSRSAFTGSGFTTAESKMVVDHPVRRRIVMRLMLLGNAGLVSSVGTLMLSLTEVQSTGQGVVGLRRCCSGSVRWCCCRAADGSPGG
ncbi:MAG TPA: hypothetical protein VIQ30_27270 [Pseudonocardia sp.]